MTVKLTDVQTIELITKATNASRDEIARWAQVSKNWDVVRLVCQPARITRTGPAPSFETSLDYRDLRKDDVAPFLARQGMQAAIETTFDSLLRIVQGKPI